MISFKFINISSADPVRLGEFYGSALDAKVDMTLAKEYGRVELSWDNCSVGMAIAKCDNPQPRECIFEFDTDDIDELYERLVSKGVEVLDVPKDLPWGYRYFVLRDVDGNTVDVTQKI